MRKIIFILFLSAISFSGYSQSGSTKPTPESINRSLDACTIASRPDTATLLPLLRKTRTEAQNIYYREGEIRAVYKTAETYIKSGRADTALILLPPFIEMALNSKDEPLHVKGKLLQARAAAKNQDYRLALKTNREVRTLTMGDNASRDHARANLGMGENYLQVNSYDSAMTYLMQAERIYTSLADTAGLTETLRSKGRLQVLTGNFEDALRILNRNDLLLRAVNDSVGLTSNMVSIGTVYQKNKEIDEALVHYRAALELAEKLNLPLDIAVLNGNIGSSLVTIDKADEGLPYLEKALEIKRAAGAAQTSIFHTLLDMAGAYNKLEDYPRSLELAQTVIEDASMARNAYYTAYGHLHRAVTFERMRDFEPAYFHMNEFAMRKDSILNADRTKQIENLQISYETEKKDQELISLSREKELEANTKRLYLFLAIAVLILGIVVYNQQRIKTEKNRQLLEKEKEVDRLKTNFFANISHEFRTPLTLIIGPLEKMRAQATNPAAAEELSMMQRNANRLLRLINDILDLAKFEAGQPQLRVRKIDASAVVRGVAMSFASMADSRKIRYEVDVNPVDNTFFDQEKLETILINILSNAFKFTPDGGHIALTTSLISDQADGTLEIQVTDSGAGIPADKRARIFDRFYQVDDSATRKHQGTGIGLAFTRELVHLHSGAIEITSLTDSETDSDNPHTGTTVSIRLPIGTAHLPPDALLSGEEIQVQSHTASDLAEAQPNSADTEPATDPSSSAKPHLLIIEDNADMRAYVRSILHHDYAVTTAPDGEAGLNMAFDTLPDLIISDVMMPKKDGYEVAATLKTDQRTSHIPVILLTAKSSSASRLKGLETEADMYLNKPFMPRELQLNVRNLLAARARMRERYNREVTLKPADIAINSVEERFLNRLMAVIEQHHTNPEFSVEDLGREIGLSRSQLHRKLQALTNGSTSHFIRNFRLQRAMDLLRAKAGTISEIAYQVGFNNVSYFNKCFLALYGHRPGEVV